VFGGACINNKYAGVEMVSKDQPISLPPNPQHPGDATEGYNYLVTGDYLKSGIPYNIFRRGPAKEPQNYLGRTGDNANVPYSFNIIYAPNGAKIAAPNCLFCHASVFEDRLVIGLGNSLLDFSMPQDANMAISRMAVKMLASLPEQQAAKNLLTATNTTSSYLVTASKGVNIADRLTAVLAAHRDPKSFVWSDKALLKIPEEVIPSDVPPWWILKKKNGMFYSGFGRGDFSRFLMAANLLTVTDTAEAAQVLTHFDDVMAYLFSLEPPKYPYKVNETLAREGRNLFEANCSKCHGTYGPDGRFPNLLVPTHIVKTDSALVRSNFSDPQFLDWFRQSWFRSGSRPAELVPFNGYIAPPLDGIWITAPYLHNGSVPNLETLLNSKLRPAYWERNFEKPEYDYQKVGWKFVAKDRQYTRSTYNTTLNGYGNSGHYFGDKLTDNERNAVIEYLKTL
jgi:Cytochrome c